MMVKINKILSVKLALDKNAVQQQLQQLYQPFVAWNTMLLKGVDHYLKTGNSAGKKNETC